MPTFLSLATELQLFIISNIPLNDIENVALSSKFVRQLCKKRLMEQYARRRYFSTIAIGHVDNVIWDGDQQVRGVHPLLILRDILADPQTWLYTKTLIIGCIEEDECETFDDQEEAELDGLELQDVAAQFGRNMRLTRKVLEVQQRLYPERGEFTPIRSSEARRWIKEILSGGMEVAAILLIAILPNLQKLRFVNQFRVSVNLEFLRTLRVLLCAAVDEEHGPTGINSFKKLTEVGLHGLDDQFGGANSNILSDFMMLPSLQIVKGRIVDGSAGPGNLARPSNVTSLEFDQSAIEAAVFSNMLCSIKGLKSFAYSFWYRAQGYAKQGWQPRQIIQALESYTSETLGHLDITSLGRVRLDDICFEKGEPFIDTLCGFQVLETIRLETMMLYKEIEDAGSETRDHKYHKLSKKEDWEYAGKKWVGGADALVEPQRLVDILPVSTCRLRLVGGLSKKDATAMLQDLPALKDDYVPDLLSIFFEDVERCEIDENVVRGCEDSGVKMKFWRPSA